MEQRQAERTALYRFYAEDGELLYIGITANPKKRLAEHAASKPWWTSVARHDIAWFDNRASAASAEREAIASEGPLHNSQHALPDLAPEVAAVFAKYKHDHEMERHLRGPMLELADRELKAGATVGELAKLTGLTPEVFRRRARALGVERKRPPTVGKLSPSAPERTEAPPQAASPRRPTRQARPKAAPGRGPAMSDTRAKTLATLARERASEQQRAALNQAANEVSPAYRDFAVVASAQAMDLLSIAELHHVDDDPPATEED